MDSIVELSLWNCKHCSGDPDNFGLEGEKSGDSYHASLAVIGIGNPLVLSDSVALRMVARTAKSIIDGRICFINIEDRFSYLSSIFASHSKVVIVDCISMHLSALETVFLELSGDPLQTPDLSNSFASTHGLSWMDEVKIHMKRNPSGTSFFFFGIETQDLSDTIPDDDLEGLILNLSNCLREL